MHAALKRHEVFAPDVRGGMRGGGCASVGRAHCRRSQSVNLVPLEEPAILADTAVARARLHRPAPRYCRRRGRRVYGRASSMTSVTPPVAALRDRPRPARSIIRVLPGASGSQPRHRVMKVTSRRLRVAVCQACPGPSRARIQSFRAPEDAGDDRLFHRPCDGRVDESRRRRVRSNFYKILSPGKITGPRSRGPERAARRATGWVFRRHLILTLRIWSDRCSQQRQALRRQDVRLFADSVGVGLVQLPGGDVQSPTYAHVLQALLVVPGRSNLHVRLQPQERRRPRHRGST